MYLNIQFISPYNQTCLIITEIVIPTLIIKLLFHKICTNFLPIKLLYIDKSNISFCIIKITFALQYE